MSEAITPWIHIVAVTIWLGPQFFLFLVAGPAVRLIEDAKLRSKVMRAVAIRFGWLAWAALAVIVMTGVSNLFQEQSESSIDISSSDYRYYHLFSLKMVLVGLAVILTAVHSFVIGPRQLALAENPPDDPQRMASLRRLSMVVSGLVLLLSIAVVYVAALLANHDYSFHAT
jgi:uncharacterized membrane protein